MARSGFFLSIPAHRDAIGFGVGWAVFRQTAGSLRNERCTGGGPAPPGTSPRTTSRKGGSRGGKITPRGGHGIARRLDKGDGASFRTPSPFRSRLHGDNSVKMQFDF